MSSKPVRILAVSSVPLTWMHTAIQANLDEIPHEKQCDWLKKQYKKLAKKWHPDKAKGNRARYISLDL